MSGLDIFPWPWFFRWGEIAIGVWARDERAARATGYAHAYMFLARVAAEVPEEE